MIKRVTLKDIATRANVSVSTVSYALNEDSTILLAEQTRSRIRRIARELGYVPNSMARALQSSSSRTIGVLLDKPLSNPRYGRIAEGIRQGLSDHDHDLLLVDVDRDRSSERYIDDARGGRIDGLIFIGHDELGVDADLEAGVRRFSIPFVTLDCGESTGDAPFATVDFDYAEGVRALIGALANRGIRNVIYVRPDVTSRAERLREGALMKALTQVQGTVSIVRTMITDANLTAVERGSLASYVEHLSAQVREVLSRSASDPDATAVVCSWGSDVEYVYPVAYRHSSRLLVCGLAGGRLSEQVWPNLVYSQLPLEEAGRACAQLILEEVRPEAPHRRITLTPSLHGPTQLP